MNDHWYYSRYRHQFISWFRDTTNIIKWCISPYEYCIVLYCIVLYCIDLTNVSRNWFEYVIHSWYDSRFRPGIVSSFNDIIFLSNRRDTTDLNDLYWNQLLDSRSKSNVSFSKYHTMNSVHSLHLSFKFQFVTFVEVVSAPTPIKNRSPYHYFIFQNCLWVQLHHWFCIRRVSDDIYSTAVCPVIFDVTLDVYVKFLGDELKPKSPETARIPHQIFHDTFDLLIVVFQSTSHWSWESLDVHKQVWTIH